jgi:adenylate kinase
MPTIIVLMGPQGAGKGTQAKKVADRFGLPVVATGEMLREVGGSDTELGRRVKAVQESGQLVSDDILADVVNERTELPDCRGGYILDGFPRTLPQAQLLDSIAERQSHRVTVVSIEVPRDLLYRRLTGRRTCTACGTIYNVHSKPSKVEGICDLCGNTLFTRADDNEEAIAKRLALYDEKTKPILDFYSETGRLKVVDGGATPEEVFERVLAALS